jgi:hypothetical protein
MVAHGSLSTIVYLVGRFLMIGWHSPAVPRTARHAQRPIHDTMPLPNVPRPREIAYFLRTRQHSFLFRERAVLASEIDRLGCEVVMPCQRCVTNMPTSGTTGARDVPSQSLEEPITGRSRKHLTASQGLLSHALESHQEQWALASS